MFTAYSDLGGADERLKAAKSERRQKTISLHFAISLQFPELIDDVFDLDGYSDFEFFCIRDR